MHNHINYATLETNVAAWVTDWIECVLEKFGEEAAAGTREELQADPWKALQWFVEDQRRELRAIAA